MLVEVLLSKSLCDSIEVLITKRGPLANPSRIELRACISSRLMPLCCCVCHVDGVSWMWGLIFQRCPSHAINRVETVESNCFVSNLNTACIRRRAAL